MKFVKLGKAEQEEIETEGTWAISYGDMITLLLSFFVIFFTTDFDKKKQQSMNEQVMQEIVTIDLAQQLKGKGRDKAGEKAGGQSTGASAAQLNENLIEGVAKIEVIPWEKNLIIKFSDVSFFKSGKVDLTEDGEKSIRAFVAKYLPYAGTYKLSVKAFTDRRKVVQISGRFKDNLELSALRAVAAMRELKKNGIPLTRMDIAGHGEMVKIQNYLANSEKLTDQQKNALSRTIVMIIKPEKEESFL